VNCEPRTAQYQLSHLRVYRILSALCNHLGAFDLLGYVTHGDKPSVSEAKWMVGVYVVAWFSAEIWERFKRDQKRIDELESRLTTIEKKNQK